MSNCACCGRKTGGRVIRGGVLLPVCPKCERKLARRTR